MTENSYSIELTGIIKQFSCFRLDLANLALPRGQIMGLIGPNGAGKTTTIRIILGLLRPDRGRVAVLGHELPAGGPAAREKIGYVSEDMRLYPGVTIGWIMKWTAGFYPAWDEAYARHLLERMNLQAGWKIKILSRGQNLKLLLLLALARRPRLLVMDEPTAGLDPLARSEFLEEMQSVLADEEKSILFSSHITNDVERIADRVAFIGQGQILEAEEKETILEKWRKIQFELDPAVPVPLPEPSVRINRSGRLVDLTTGAFSGQWLKQLEAAGAANLFVHSLTLEEIFLARLRQQGGRP